MKNKKKSQPKSAIASYVHRNATKGRRGKNPSSSVDNYVHGKMKR